MTVFESDLTLISIDFYTYFFFFSLVEVLIETPQSSLKIFRCALYFHVSF